MARGRFTVIFTILGFAVFISIAGFIVLYLLFGREPTVTANSTPVEKDSGIVKKPMVSSALTSIQAANRNSVAR